RALVDAAGDPESDPDAAELASRLARGEPAPPAEARWALLQLLEGVARRRPCVVVLDDLQRAGQILVDFVDDVAGGLGAPVALLCPLRDDKADRPPAAGVAVALGPLGERDADTLLDALLAGAELDPALRRRLTDAAGGNPLFCEELVAMLDTPAASTLALPPTL